MSMHESHVLEPFSDDVGVGHDKHEAKPGLSAYVAASHERHFVAPAESLYAPKLRVTYGPMESQ